MEGSTAKIQWADTIKVVRWELNWGDRTAQEAVTGTPYLKWGVCLKPIHLRTTWDFDVLTDL